MNRVRIGIIAAFAAIVLLAGSLSLRRGIANRSDHCIRSFDYFAYVVPDKNAQPEKSLPLPPWAIESSGPGNLNLDVLAIRNVEAGLEIWTGFDCQYDEDPFWIHDCYFWVYRTATKDWQKIPALIENSKEYVGKIYVAQDGSIWGTDSRSITADINKPPISSKYNEQTQRFEFLDDSRETPPGWKINNPLHIYRDILVDSNGLFWVFVDKDAIYSFDPVTQQVVRHIELAGFDVIGASLAPDGSIYLRMLDRFSMGFTLEEGELFQFLPQTGELKTLETPDGYWPGFGRILVDHSGRLWLDAVGYRNPDGSWQQLHPNVLSYWWEIEFSDNWVWYDAPSIYSESSDGRLLFITPQSDFSGHKSGIAWFDPNTGQGCWFTTVGDNVVEDDQKTMWLMADGTLYKYSLLP